MTAGEFITLLMSRGLFSDLAIRVSKQFSDWEAFSSAPASELSTAFDSSELEELRKAKSRREIPKATVQRLIDECEFRCCLCWNIDSDAGVVLHHIRPHSSIPDDSYENLVVLCADHHARVHTTWELARHPYPPELLRLRKGHFVTAIAAFRSGQRVAPGREKGNEESLLARPPRSSPYFLGRDTLIKNIAERLAESNSRVALVGMGGVGKTAILLQIAETYRDHFAGGILWTEINAGSSGQSDLLRKLIRDLGRDATGLDLPEQLAYLANLLEARVATQGKCLLLIDDVNLTVVDEVVSLTTYLPPSVAVLASTRDMNVGIAVGLTQFKLEPLEREHSRQLLEQVSNSSTVRKEVDSVNSLLDQLGDLPLAVELVGRQIAVRERKPGFSISAVCSRLNEFDQQWLSFPGHRGIALSFALSYDNLSDDERYLFRSLGSFASGSLFVSYVAAIAGEVDESVTEVIMDRLVSVSILEWGHSPGDYRIHPLLHKYAEFQLTQSSATEHEAVQLRHSRFFIDLAKTAATDMPKGLSLLDRSFGNISRAIRHASDRHDHKSVVEVVMCLVVDAHYFITRNLDNESIPLLEISIESAKAICDLHAESAQRGHLGSAFSRTGMVERAMSQYEQAIVLARRTGNDYDLASHLQNIGCTLISEAANPQRAEQLLHEGIKAAQRSFNSEAMIGCLSSLGGLHRQMGSLESAADLYSKALQSARLFKNRLAEGNNLSNLGLVVDQLGNSVEAERMIREALSIAVEIGDKRGEGNRIGHLGGLLFAKAADLPSGVDRSRALESAREHLSTARDIAQATNDFQKCACWMMNLANIAALEGHMSECINRLEEVLGLIQRRGFGLLEAQVHFNLGNALDRFGQIESAMAHLRKSSALLKRMGSPMASQADERIRRLSGTLSSISRD